MEKLNQIRQELLEAHKKLAKALKFGKDDYRYFTIEHTTYFITNDTFGMRKYADDEVVEIEVSDFDGRQKIYILGDATKAIRLVKQMKQWRKIANLVKDIDTKEYYLSFYKRIEKSIVRNGNEYEVDGFKFYFPNLYSMQITKGSFYVVVERIEKQYCTDEKVQYGGSDMLDYIKTNEEKIITNLLEQMSEEAIFGAQCVKEDFLDEAKEMEREFETDNL